MKSYAQSQSGCAWSRLLLESELRSFSAINSIGICRIRPGHPTWYPLMLHLHIRFSIAEKVRFPRILTVFTLTPMAWPLAFRLSHALRSKSRL